MIVFFVLMCLEEPRLVLQGRSIALVFGISTKYLLYLYLLFCLNQLVINFLPIDILERKWVTNEWWMDDRINIDDSVKTDDFNESGNDSRL